MLQSSLLQGDLKKDMVKKKTYCVQYVFHVISCHLERKHGCTGI